MEKSNKSTKQNGYQRSVNYVLVHENYKIIITEYEADKIYKSKLKNKNNFSNQQLAIEDRRSSGNESLGIKLITKQDIRMKERLVRSRMHERGILVIGRPAPRRGARAEREVFNFGLGSAKKSVFCINRKM